ncbi:LysR family transcriptional regulator [Aliivibrio fischeri]|uniref:LysR family transcriptional regulator n=1 Tax=Aliivibrio fischeri TaxID=668 RepID=UPI00080DF122|nr:LysR family transcriptional regulator [Aliivibrio fischeri]MUH96904.1 LysR family transcriptional regulator [Aliivibrio fischeri]MUI65827.1 LysR family transcriptional regulator [Aliivibrio fischeri]OCH07992.1 LysR family transcriptional regulator [Aliivibrio fischeri]OCH34121.1 LysR family transcriptional regulator [Aliivibrio fischeri]OED51435.1 LysR family transcriptional regulator [Aliivibrio fischeri]
MFKLMLQFIQVAKAQNVTQAANTLCLSQPTLSHNMQKLEEKLGSKLFYRNSKGITLTSSGEVLYEQAKMMQHLYENTLHKLEKNKLRHQTELKIGCGDAWWHLFVRDCVQDFRDTNPHSNITIDVGDHLQLMNLLLSDEISIFVGHEILGLAQYEDILFHPLFSSHEEVYVRKDHPLLERVCSDEDIARFPSVDLGASKKRYAHLVQQQNNELSTFQKRHYLQEKVIYNTNSLLTALDLLQNSDAILPYPVGMKAYFEGFGIVPLKMKKCFGKATIGAYLHKDGQQNKQSIALLEQFKELIKSNPQIKGKE